MMASQKVPIGFGNALAGNENAVNAYAMMTREQKAAVLKKAHAAHTQAEMHQLINSLAADQIP